jgi:hypothetical protein
MKYTEVFPCYQFEREEKFFYLDEEDVDEWRIKDPYDA